jgi:hypothetical protein
MKLNSGRDNVTNIVVHWIGPGRSQYVPGYPTRFAGGDASVVLVTVASLRLLVALSHVQHNGTLSRGVFYPIEQDIEQITVAGG